MQKIEAVIRPEKILEVKDALEKLGYGGLTVTEVKGHGNQRGVIETWEDKEFWIEFLTKMWCVLVVDDTDAEAVIAAICAAAHRRARRRQDLRLGHPRGGSRAHRRAWVLSTHRRHAGRDRNRHLVRRGSGQLALSPPLPAHAVRSADSDASLGEVSKH